MFGKRSVILTSEKKKNLIFFILLVFCKVLSFSQTENFSLKGIALSNSLYSFFLKADAVITEQPLVPYDNGYYPHNLILYTDNDYYETDETKQIVFAFTQEFAWKHRELILNYYRQLCLLELSYRPVVLFTANDEILLDDEYATHKGGSSVFAETVENPVQCAVITVSSSPDDTVEITSGSSDTSPSYLVRSLREACYACSVNKPVTNSFSSFYKTGFLKTNRRLSTFMDEQIPSAGISIKGNYEDFRILLKTAEKLSVYNSSLWDRHYTLLRAGNSDIYLSEIFFVLAYLLFSIIMLLLLCYISFFGKYDYHIKQKAVFRSAYIVPELILLSAAIPFLLKTIFNVNHDSTVASFNHHIFTLLIFPVLFIIIQNFINRQISSFALSFFTLLTGAINVIIFSNIELSLIYLLFIEFLLLYLTSRFNSPVSICISTVLCLFPAYFFLQDFFNFASPYGFNFFAGNSISLNLILTQLMLPFEFQFIRFLISVNIFDFRTNDSKTNFFHKIVPVILMYALFFSAVSFIEKKADETRSRRINAEVKQIETTDSVREDFSVKVNDRFFMDLTTRSIFITSKSRVLRYIVKVYCDTSVPLFDCNHAYILETSKTAVISIPDYPGEQIIISYSTDASYATSIIVEAFIEEAPDKIVRESRIIYPEVYSYSEDMEDL